MIQTKIYRGETYPSFGIGDETLTTLVFQTRRCHRRSEKRQNERATFPLLHSTTSASFTSQVSPSSRAKWLSVGPSKWGLKTAATADRGQRCCETSPWNGVLILMRASSPAAPAHFYQTATTRHAAECWVVSHFDLRVMVPIMLRHLESTATNQDGILAEYDSYD